MSHRSFRDDADGPPFLKIRVGAVRQEQCAARAPKASGVQGYATRYRSMNAPSAEGV
jgi:hypothetical protein